MRYNEHTHMKYTHVPIVVGIVLPFVFIIGLGLMLYIPTLGIQPQHNFVYTYEPYTYTREQASYSVGADGHLVAASQPVGSTTPGGLPTVYLYDVHSNTTHQISLSEAHALTL